MMAAKSVQRASAMPTDLIAELGPPHLPGRNARPTADGIVAELHEAAGSHDPNRRKDAFAGALRLLESGYFWEMHEVMEPLWMAEPPNSARREALQGLIQFANGALKLRMDRPDAALRLFAIARQHFASAGADHRSTMRLVEELIGPPLDVTALDRVTRRITDRYVHYYA